MGRHVSRDSLPEEGSFVWREAEQAACSHLVLRMCENAFRERFWILLAFSVRIGEFRITILMYNHVHSYVKILCEYIQPGESFLFVVPINIHLRPFGNLTNTTWSVVRRPLETGILMAPRCCRPAFLAWGSIHAERTLVHCVFPITCRPCRDA